MVKIGIAGACGRMGGRIAVLAIENGGFEITGAFDISTNPKTGKDLGEVIETTPMGVEVTSDLESASNLDCLIDFTLPDPTLEHVRICAEKGIPMVIGTTGIGVEGEEKIKEAAQRIPIVFSPNMAIGVNLLFKIVSEAARVLGKTFDIKVDETHHVHKKDSPSGTAKMIGKVIKDAAGIDAPIEAFREGEVIGNHGIVFDGVFETLEIRHNAKSRDVFAAGSLEAAKYVVNKEPGLYSMADVLGIK